MAAPSLDVWLYGELIAQVTERRTGKFQLRYTEAALERWTVGRPLLSVSMPLAPMPYPPGVVGPFLEGLLPEGEARVVLEERYGVRRGDVAGLLAQIGRDCAGAVVVVPAGHGPPADVDEAEPVGDDSLATLLRALPDRPLGDDDEVRVSLAGQQHKLLLARRADGRWLRPLAGTPSTHILKPADQRYPDAAANEVLCLRLARGLGLSEVDAELLDVDGIEVVVISRYDRRLRDGRTERLHQEDVCQALAVDLGPRGAGKYQGHGGPGFAEVAHLLDVHNGDPGQTGRLLEVATFTVAIGNADAHGKNLSLLLPPDGRVRLAPLYDVMSTVHYPDVAGPMGPARVSTELAMFIDGEREIDAVDVPALRAEGQRWHFSDDVDDRVHGLLARFDDALEGAVSAVPQVPDALLERLRARAARLRSGAPAGA
jgi:serine/threonine-protein kinase HipA